MKKIIPILLLLILCSFASATTDIHTAWSESFEGADHTGWSDPDNEYVPSSTVASCGSKAIDTVVPPVAEKSLTYSSYITLSGNEYNLTWKMYQTTSADSNDYMCLDYSCDAGSTWNAAAGGDTILCLDGAADAEGSWVNFNLSVSSVCAKDSNFTVRLRTLTDIADEYYRADCLQLDYRPNTDLIYPVNETTYTDYNGSVIVNTYVNYFCYLNNTDWTLQGDDISDDVFNWYNPTNYIHNTSLQYMCAIEDSTYLYNESYDISGNGNTGTNMGYTWNHGELKNGVDCSGQDYCIFDGVDDYVNVTEYVLDFTNGVTLYFKANQYESENMAITGHTSTNSYRYIALLGGTNRLQSETDTNTDVFNSNDHTFDGLEHTWTISCENLYCNVYRDGINDTNDGIVTDNLSIIRLGFRMSDLGFNGTLRNFRIWNTSLSPTEVLAEYNSDAPVKSDGLVLWMPMMDRTQNTTHTYDTNHLAAGTQGEAFRGDGVGNYVNVLYNSDFNWSTTNEGCIVSTIKPNQITTDKWIIGMYSGIGSRSYGLYQDAADIRFYTDSGQFIQAYSNILSVETETQIVGCYNGTHSSIYVNGIIDGTPLARTLGNPDTTFKIGSNSGIGSYFNGTIDNVAIFNRSLTPAEVLSIYNGSASTFNPSIAPYNDGLVYFNSFDINDSITGDYEASDFWFIQNNYYDGLISEGDTFTPFVSNFSYTADDTFTVDYINITDDCINVVGSNVSAYDGTWCYNLTSLYLDDVALFWNSTDLGCNMIADMDGETLNISYDWFNKTNASIRDGITECTDSTLCDLDTLPGESVAFNDSYYCGINISNDWFWYGANTASLDSHGFGECNDYYNITLINMSYFDEITTSPINATNTYEVYFYDGFGYSPLTGGFTANTSHQFCTDYNDATVNLLMYGNFILSSPTYITRSYNIPEISGLTVSNNPVLNHSFYLIPIANSSTITFTWLTTDFQNIDGLMRIYKCNVDGTRTLIESTTISSGTAIVNLQLYSSTYSYSVIIDDQTYTDYDTYSSCHIESTTSRTYYVDTRETDIMPVIGLFTVDCTITNTSSNIVEMEWDANEYDTSDIEACIVVYRSSIYGRVEIYRSCDNASYGSITRTIPPYSNNYYVTGEITQNGIKGYCQDTIVFSQQGDLETGMGTAMTLLFAAILIVSLAFLFAGDGELSIIGSIIGILIAWLIGITSYSTTIISAIIIFLIAIVLIGKYTRKQ